MFFPEPKKQEVPPAGNPQAKIAIVGDFSNAFDLRDGRPFSHYAGQILESCLHQAGLIRGEVYLTNVIKENSTLRGKYYDETRGKFTPFGMEYVERLREELSVCGSNIIVAAGAAAMSALCSTHRVSQYRGYLFESTLLPGKKVIPIHHPAQALRGMYTYRYLIAADLSKAKEESKFPELRRPHRTLTWTYSDIGEALYWLDYYARQEIVGFDIEVLNYEVSCISMSSSPDLAHVFPVADRWTIEDEALLWRGIQRVLGNSQSTKIVQNSMFDVPFLLTRCGIEVRGEVRDTMVGHSICYPELQKGLGFLGSVYCGSQEYWKDTVKFNDIKSES